MAITLTVEATRRENTGSDEVLSNEARLEYLKPEPLIPLDGPVRSLALEAIRGMDTDAEKARAIYEKVVGLMMNLNPAQKGPPLNFFVYPYAELDGKPHPAIDRKVTFTDRGK